MTLATKALQFKSKFITAELAHLFSQSDTEEEFEGFSEDEEEDDRGCFNKQLKTKMVYSEDDSDLDTGLYSDGEEPPPPKRRSLLVALRFPMKRLSTPKQKPQEENVKTIKGTPQSWKARRKQRKQQKQDGEGEEEEEEQDDEEDQKQVLSPSLKKRNKNIQENKAMLAKLFADLSTIADLTPPITPQKKKRAAEKSTPRKHKVDIRSERRNPSRKARPPENFAVEEKSEPVTNRISRAVDIMKLMKVDKELVGLERRNIKRKRCSSRRSHYVARSVDDITKEDLDNIALRSKDKIWDKENGSSCHQCRQKTLDTKTVCRSGICGGGRGQFCGPCLKNRYGEDIRAVLLDPEWCCPICRGVCNCSLCRKKEGRCATGVLVGLARFHGHSSVHEYLKSIQKELRSSSKK